MKNIKKTERLLSTPQLRVARIDGAKTRRLKKFYRKIADRLDFPDYVAHNLDALADALSDLSWLAEPHVKIYIKNPEAFLSKENKSVKNDILEIMAEAAGNQIEAERTLEVRGVL